MSTGTARHEPLQSYDGPVRVTGPDAGVLTAEVSLRGHLQPIDGRFHWWCRLPADAVADAWGNGVAVRVATAHGEAEGRLSDVDPWGRYRVSGTGRPPF